MNDITYRPFIRDSALGDINIQIPNLEIPVYKPRYSQPLEDDTETEVQSQVEEIRNPEPIVQETTVHKFNSKKDFKDTMLPIYERLLKSKGLNPAFAKSLVAQDGLESAWGSKPAGSYNFGGIKGKGTTKRTREVINGKDVYINDQFRNFKSLEDYANFKIDLLNNKRYNAFSGDIKEFANRVHRGGYATDPRYANILNQVIASAKHGGVLKFQQGGIQEGKQWLEDWYKSCKGLVKQNVKQVLPIPLPVTESLVFNALKRNLDLTRAKINPSKVPDNASGVYYPFGRRIFLTDGSTSTAIHEWTHSSLPDAQEKVIKKYQDNFGDTVYDNKTIVPDKYLDNPQEIYARLMQLKYSINADPNHKFTKEEIQNIKKEHLDHYTLTNRLKNSEGKGSFSVSQFDKDGKIIQSEPFNPEYKIVPEESTVTPHYNKENTYNLLNRYSDDFLLYLFNNVAQAPTKKKDTTLYAQLGLKIPKYQEPSGKLMNRSTRIWMQDKNGEYAWAKRNNVSRPEFWDRLRDENKESIVDWENPNSIATHKLGYGEIDNKIIIYPEVQKVNEKLIDYTRPPYSHNAGIINAYETGNYVTAPNEKLAENFTTTYKQKYPGFIEHDVFEDEVSRDVYNSKSDKINYVYNKLLANGYTRMQASAILGSLFIEGQLDENKKETGGNGYGLLQWTDSTRKNNLKEFKSSTAKNEFERQVDFLIHELKNPDVWLGQRKLDEFLNAEDIDSATEILAKRFCRPRTGSEKMDARKEVARFYVNQQPRYSLTDKYIYGQ